MNEDSSSRAKYKIWEPLLLAVVCAVGMIAGHNLFDNNERGSLLEYSNISNTNGTAGMGRIEEILRILENSYVDTIQTDEVVKNLVENIIGELDPHSSYISPEELEAYNQRMEGIYRGIGIESIFIDDTLFVNHVKESSTAEQAGLKAGDIILQIGTDTLINNQKTIQDVQNILKDWRGTSADFTILRNKKEKLEMSISLQKTDVRSASTHYTINDRTGYVKINRFSANTYDQFFKSLEAISNKLDTEEFDLIIDLRDNPGGYLPQSLKILSQLFQNKDKLLSYTIGAHRKRKEYKSTGRNFYNIDKISVLINENSASASEIVAGAIQDWDRGVLIGRQTYGKGLVQEIFPLKNKGAIRLTVARYCTPSGRQIQKPYGNETEIDFLDSTFYTLKYNRSLVNNNGIFPDYDVEFDKISLPENGIVDSITRKVLPYTDVIPLDVLNDFENFNAKRLGELNLNKTKFNRSHIASELIYAWYGASAYYEYIQKNDACILKALEIAQVDNPLRQLASKEN